MQSSKAIRHEENISASVLPANACHLIKNTTESQTNNSKVAK
ncbi:Hypothetical protein LOCK908_2595 [Lacticaseibacillus rhamnosus LOCK908]|uniref:Uncharacterized protein n=2 Tax=Lacticaseibacillus rhamnosus TaxID=47715 RepID=C2JVE2_LACRM|nr:conserved hypothetical protein [Lacticaseibacillus rhamnosus ATCC 8530]AGP75202.1 Hypothetical protein LOCK908_2595 [Lacticaseibacillus rhamnosus LOCK908]ASY48443.1 hypothetical protein N507_1267 [Lacticaseibacillus rhamnosus DSM 14870]EEN80997.1 hypothetical protein HMPREF0539_0876 [Lacticaseibacillus rhamnosus LMS2-1]EKS48908.1 hypothetical protein LRHMDP2_2668 [Lacticaseibacillus rhamnosus LRHMDP2]EKS50365.1 hypothetical protein LRHMDP3_1894 [Lacticaseibacillus rhamnosus LRHMDP3]